MVLWCAQNRDHVRRLWRKSKWKKKGFVNYEGVGLGGKEMDNELRRKVENLRERIHHLNHQYYVQCVRTEASDAQYDELLAELKELEQRHPELEDPNSPTMKVGAPVLAGLDEVKHKVPMLSLEKAKDVASLIHFFGGSECEGVIEPKIDGASLSVHYINGRLVQAVTRGDGIKGKDVTHSARTIRSLPLMLKGRKLTIEVRGEVFIRWSSFDEYNRLMEDKGEDLAANPRNAAAGALGLKDPADCARVPLDFIAYQIVKTDELAMTYHTDVVELLEELGFFTTSLLPMPIESTEGMFQFGFALNDEDEVRRHIARLDKARRVQDFPTDGLVFKVNDLAVQRELGVAATHPKWAIAYKFQPDRAKTTIKQIEWTVGKTGKITPVALLEPILLSGSKISKASLCNPDEIKRLDVNVGDEVVLEKSNEIIPKIIQLATKQSKGFAKPPAKCPACGAALSNFQEFVDVFCLNSTCSAQSEAKLVWATGKHGLDIDGCGPQAVALCLENGIKTLSALLAEKEFAFFKGAARKKMQTGVKKALEAPFWRKLSALCIEGWGQLTCQEAATKWPTFRQLIEALDVGEVKNVFRDSKAHQLDLFASAYEAEIVALDSLDFFPAKAEETESVLAGKSFCITGSITGVPDRADVEEEIRKRGGVTKSSVSRKLNYLVVGDSPGNNKLIDAKRWGTKCLTPDQLFEMLAWRPKHPVTINPDKEY